VSGTRRAFVMWPDKRLRTRAADVAEITDAVRRVWDDMIETMDAMPGVGLAAPQIGVMLRLAVVDASETRGHAIRMANPEVLVASDATNDHEEASPNLPGTWAKITRPAVVTVAFTDQHGIRVRQEFTGLWATSVQHQIDHLAGRMYFDRLTRMKREMLLKRALKGAR